MNNFIWLFIIVILLLITVIVFTKKSKEKFNFIASYNYNRPVKYFRKGRKTKHKNKNQANQLNDTYPECTPDDLSTKGCSQCPPPNPGQDTYCCMNGNPPACSSSGGGPIAGCTPQCVIKYKPPAPVEECTQEQIYQDQCNKCQDGYYCCPSSDPKLAPGCSSTQFPSCTTNQCKYHKPSLRTKRTFSFKNSCQEPVCVGYLGQSASTAGGSYDGGFQLTAGASTTKQFPGDWISGRLWPRTGCDSKCTNCQTGDCGAMSCTRSGDNPASLFEISMDKTVGYDTYDGSLVDGYNVPISVTPTSGSRVPGVDPKYDCTPNSCPSTQLSMANCPPELIKKDSNNNPVGCYSLCHAISDPKNQAILDQRCKSGAISGCPGGYNDLLKNKDLYCCSCGDPKAGCPTSQLPTDPKTGTPINGCAIDGTQKESVSTIKQCCNFGCSPLSDPGKSLPTDESPVCSTANWPTPSGFCQNKGITTAECTYPNLFKKQCPDFYSWQFDDIKSTYQCLNSDYEVEFCPPK
jgi:hypothetical protein